MAGVLELTHGLSIKMKFKIIASGSKGNCTYLEVENKKYLIDLGISLSYLKESLKEISVDLNDIDGIFITHTHVDHIHGLQTYLKRYSKKVYLSKKMYDTLKDYVNNYSIIEDDFLLENLSIKIIRTSHDVDSYGYIFEDNQKSLVYITDTGYLNVRFFPKITNKTAYIFESNHDDEMLNNSSYPFYLKQRIRSPKGHLSNHDAAEVLSKIIGEETEVIYLAHLSEENNTEEKAFTETFNKTHFKNLHIAKQNNEMELLEI